MRGSWTAVISKIKLAFQLYFRRQGKRVKSHAATMIPAVNAQPEPFWLSLLPTAQQEIVENFSFVPEFTK